MNDPYIWTSSPLSNNNPLHRSLQEFENSLCCPICKNIFTNPVLITATNCQHTFCSECLRNHFRKGRHNSKGSSSIYCPTCRSVTDERKLVPNRALAENAKRWAGIKESLFGVVSQHENLKLESSNDNDAKSKRKAELQQKHSKARKRPRRSTRQTSTTYQSDSDFSCEENESDYEDDRNTDAKEKSNRKSASSETVKASTSNVTLKPKPLTNYHSLNRKQLVRLCENEGLSTQGKPGDLKERHREFITLYNAECDSITPRSHVKLVQVVKSRERERKKEKLIETQKGTVNHATYLTRLIRSSHQAPLTKKDDACSEQAENVVVTSGNKDFDKKINDGFKDLIKNMRKRSQQNPKTAPVSDSNNDRDESSTVLCSGDMNDNNEIILSPRESTDVTTKNTIVGMDSVKARKISSTSSPEKSVEQNTIVSSSSSASSTQLSPISKASSNRISPFRQRSQHKLSPSSEKQSIIGPWTCSVCTFENRKRTWSSATCEMCGMGRRAVSKLKNVFTIDV